MKNESIMIIASTELEWPSSKNKKGIVVTSTVRNNRTGFISWLSLIPPDNKAMNGTKKKYTTATPPIKLPALISGVPSAVDLKTRKISGKDVNAPNIMNETIKVGNLSKAEIF